MAVQQEEHGQCNHRQQQVQTVLPQEVVADFPPCVGIFHLGLGQQELLCSSLVVLHVHVGLAAVQAGVIGVAVEFQNLIQQFPGFLILARIVMVDGRCRQLLGIRRRIDMHLSGRLVKHVHMAVIIHADAGRRLQQTFPRHIQNGAAEAVEQNTVLGELRNVAVLVQDEEGTVLRHVHVHRIDQHSPIPAIPEQVHPGVAELLQGNGRTVGQGINQPVRSHHDGAVVLRGADAVFEHLLVGEDEVIELVDEGGAGGVGGEEANELAIGIELYNAVGRAVRHYIDAAVADGSHRLGLEYVVHAVSGRIRLGILHFQLALGVVAKDRALLIVRHIDAALRICCHAGGLTKFPFDDQYLAGGQIHAQHALVARIGDIHHAVFHRHVLGGFQRQSLKHAQRLVGVLHDAQLRSHGIIGECVAGGLQGLGAQRQQQEKRKQENPWLFHALNSLLDARMGHGIEHLALHTDEDDQVGDEGNQGGGRHHARPGNGASLTGSKGAQVEGEGAQQLVIHEG